MRLQQHQAPLFEALVAYTRTVKAPFHVPGHKMGRAAADPWRSWMGDQALSIDLTEAPGLDDLHAPEGVIAQAQTLAAEAFGAAKSFFLVGGTTAGLHALVLAACRPGDTIAVPRHAHRSVLGALILAGAKPAWIPCEYHHELDLAVGVNLDSVGPALQGAAAAMFVYPTYYGNADALSSCITAAHDRGVPVLVDEAHGAHFAFHPNLPPSALALGADGVAQSIHKTGGSLTQSSLCHLGVGHRLSETRLSEMLRLVQSTSPSYLLMASLDAARRQLAIDGHNLWSRTIALAHEAHRQIRLVAGITTLDTDDPTKVVIVVHGRGITGIEAADHLWTYGVAVESAGVGWILAVLSPGDSPDTVRQLVQSVATLPHGNRRMTALPVPPLCHSTLTPRDAFLSEKESIPLEQAAGRVAAEMVAPYPPGIPVVVPGESITTDVVAYLQSAKVIGYHIQGPSDPQLHSIQVVKE